MKLKRFESVKIKYDNNNNSNDDDDDDDVIIIIMKMTLKRGSPVVSVQIQGHAHKVSMPDTANILVMAAY